MNRSPRVAILGAGPIGQAITHLLRRKKITPRIWDVDPKKNTKKQTLATTLTGAEIVFLCVPSWCMRSALESLKPYLGKKTVLASLAKGIEPDTRLTMDQLIEKVLPDHPYALLAGPMLATEISANMGAGAVIATTDARVLKSLKNLFAQTRLTCEFSNDVHGVAIASILKNIYAIGLGLADGLKMGLNQKGVLLAMAIDEMHHLLPLFEGKSQTARSLAGTGDFIATALSPSSKNHSFGVALAQKKNTLPPSEGPHSLRSLLSLLPQKTKDFPLLHALERIIIHRQDSKRTFQSLSLL